MAQSCNVCQRFFKSQHATWSSPWPYTKIQSKSYLLMVDYYSRYIRRLNITTSNATIDILTQVFRKHRVLTAVMPDNGAVKLLQARTAFWQGQHGSIQVLLWPLARFVLGCPKFKSLAMLVNNQLVASCQLAVLILLCSVCILFLVLWVEYLQTS